MIQMDNISYNDFPRICRFCLKLGEHKNFFTTGFNILFDIITNIKIEEDDKLPNKVCDSCNSAFQKIEAFMIMCKDNYVTLLNILEKKREKDGNFLEQIKDNNVITSVSDEEQIISHNEKYELYDTDDKKQIKLCEEVSDARELEIITMSCKYCDKTFRRLKNLENHTLTHSNNKPFQCGICPALFPRKSSFISHQLIHCNINNPSSDSCSSQCGLDQPSKQNLMVSVKNMDGRKKWRCIYCEKFFSKKDDLQRHHRIHTGYRPFQCKFCEKKFTQNSTLVRHIHSKHADREGSDQTHLECYVCEKKFIRKDHLEMHVINLHVKKQTFVSERASNESSCTKCGKSFSLIAYLEQHIDRVHRSGKFKIKSNNRKAVDKSQLCSSVPKLCSICGKLFQKGKTYHAHMSRYHSIREKKIKTQTEVKPKPKDKYQCWHCGKIVNSQCNLSVHLRVHTGEKPYQCKFCPRRFSVWTCRQEHENIHTGVKPFQCDLCDKAFKQRSALLKHLRSAIHRIQSKT